MAQTLKRTLKIGLRVLLGLILFAPIPIFIMWFNQTTAETAAENAIQFERDSAVALLNGEALARADQINERLLLSQLIENLQEPFNTIAIGSSRIMQMSAALAGEDNFYNCGLSGADYRDIMNVYYQFEKADKLPQTIILALDPWILNADPTKLHGQSDTALFTEFMATRLGYPTAYTPPPAEDNLNALKLLNPATFQANLNYMQSDENIATPPTIVQGDIYDQATQVKMPDGTALYPLSYRDADAQILEERARLEATTFLHMDGYLTPDADLCLLFHRFIQHVRSQNVNVVLLLMPYNPWVYTYANENPTVYPGFFLTEPWFTRYAQLYDIPLYGSYNPFVTNTKTSEYFDGLHVKPEAIPGFFPGVPAVERAQKKGSAYSPWLMGGARIQYPVAKRLVEEQQNIPPPEITQRGMDEIINGEVCYLVHRYSDDGDTPTHLATYAVTRREGIVYRWDTDLMNWVMDPRF